MSDNSSNSADHTLKTVSIMGRRAAFHDIAAEHYFADLRPTATIKVVESSSFDEMLGRVVSGSADFGIMAIENSIAGSIMPNYPRLRAAKLHVVGEIYLLIGLNLCAHHGVKIEELSKVFSHPMAILESQHFFEKYPQIIMTQGNDTAGCAKQVADSGNRKHGSISSKKAAQLYNLELLAEQIEDNPHNITRFLILSTEQNLSSHVNKATLCFSNTVDTTLATILAKFEEHGVIATQVHSLPQAAGNWDYFFHLDVVFEQKSQFNKALESSSDLISSYQILGLYVQGKEVKE